MSNKIYKSPLALAQDEFHTLINEDEDTYRETLRNKKGWSAEAANNYPALKQLNKNVGDILTSKTGRRYRIDNPSDLEGLKTWGKDHILLRQVDDKDNDIFDFGSYGWFPIGEYLKK